MKHWIAYRSAFLRQDVVAALTVAAISLPQGMAYALLAGVDPRYGLYSAIVVTAVASIFGSSSHLINGPTSAISLVVFSALSVFDPDQRPEATEAMFLIGAMVGCIQILVAVFRLGDLTRYISESVITGFMAAAALMLAVAQISNALGVPDKGSGMENLFYRLWLTLSTSDGINLKAAYVTAVTLVLAVLARRAVLRYRLLQFDMLAVLVIVSAGSVLLGWTVPDVFGKTAIGVAGSVPSSLPSLHIPVAKPGQVMALAWDSLAIAFLGLLEALAIAKSIASQTNQRLDFNRQCLAEGIANLTGSFFQCVPGSGSLSRSAINFQSGAATRFSGLLTALFVAVAVLCLAPLAQYVPKPALAALLLLTAARLVDVKRLGFTIRASRMDVVVAGVTAASALVFGLDLAILIGIAMSVVLFVPRAAKVTAGELIVDQNDVVREKQPSDPPNLGFLLYDLEGELFFGAGPELERTLATILSQAHRNGIHHVMLRLKRARNPDAVGLEQIEQFLRRAQAADIVVWLAGVQPDLLDAFRRQGYSRLVPDYRLFPQGSDEESATLAAIRHIRTLVDGPRAKQADALSYRV
jgi:SulP family sulfate permease